MHAFSTQFLKGLDINGEKFYVLPDGPTVFKADEITDAILNAVSQNKLDLPELASLYGEAALNEAMSELSQILGERGADLVQERKVVAESSDAQSRYTVSLGVAGDCNMACTYCYQGSNKPTTRMSQETAIAAVDLLAQQATNARAEIHFYGGEPLLNWECVRATVEYATKVFGSVELWLITNGVLLTVERIRYLATAGVFIAVSLDGPPELHDMHRKFPNGSGTHAIVVQNLKQAVEFGCNVTAEVTLTKQHIRIWPEIMHYLQQLGVKDIVVNPLETEDPVQRFTDQDWRQLANMYEQIALAGEQLPYAFLRRYLGRVTNGRRKYYRCQAGRTMFYVAPDGRLFPCAGFYYLGAGEMEMGHIRQGIDAQRQEQILAAYVDHVPACRECWARYFCGGPCIYRAVKDNRDLRLPSSSDCQMMRAMVESAVRVRIQQIAGEKSASALETEMQHCN